MASAVARMALYTSLYGLTELRLYTTAFMGWLAIVFLWFGATVLRGQRYRFAVGAMVTGFVAIGVLNALNPDALIARTNLGRIDSPLPVDGRYLGSLSADAVPTLVAGLPSLTESERNRLMNALQARWFNPPSDWRTWNWSRSQATAAVTGASSRSTATSPSVTVPGASSPAASVDARREPTCEQEEDQCR
jgi:hypothetical protein